MDWYQIFGLILSVIAIIVAAISFWKSYTTQKQMTDIEAVRESDRKSEMNQAQLIAEIAKETKEYFKSRPQITEYYLRITNKGRSEARNVGVVVNGENVFESEHFHSQAKSLPVIGPLSHTDIRIMYNIGWYPPLSVKLLWEDDTGIREPYKTTLTI